MIIQKIKVKGYYKIHKRNMLQKLLFSFYLKEFLVEFA